MQAVDVPTLPWSGSHVSKLLILFTREDQNDEFLCFCMQVKIPPNSSSVTIPEEIYRQAWVYTTEEAIASCEVVGYPVMIKASWGGGGKGIRKVSLCRYMPFDCKTKPITIFWFIHLLGSWC